MMFLMALYRTKHTISWQKANKLKIFDVFSFSPLKLPLTTEFQDAKIINVEKYIKKHRVADCDVIGYFF